MIIVLGGGIDKEGKLPIWVQNRLNKAIQIFRKIGGWILLSGKGQNGYKVTEAQAMASYLIGKGILENNILLEPLSEDTLQNAYFSKLNHIDPMDIDHFTVVTSAFHMERSRHIFEWVFGTGYYINYVSAGDENIHEGALLKRNNFESQLLHFHKTMLKDIPCGDLRQIRAFIFEKDNPLAIAYKDFITEFISSRALY